MINIEDLLNKLKNNTFNSLLGQDSILGDNYEKIDSYRGLLDAAKDAGILSGDEFKTLEDARSKGRENKALEKLLPMLNAEASQKGWTLYYEQSKESDNGIVLKLFPSGLIDSIEKLKEQGDKADEKQLRDLEKIIKNAPTLTVPELNKLGQGVSQHVKSQTREAILFGRGGQIETVQMMAVTVDKIAQLLKRSAPVSAGVLGDDSLVKQMGDLKRSISRIERAGNEATQNLSSNRAKNRKLNAELGKDANVGGYTGISQIYSSLGLTTVALTEQLWEALKSSAGFQERYGWKGMREANADRVAFERDFNNLLRMAMLYSEMENDQEAAKNAFENYLKTNAKQFLPAKNQLMELYDFVRKTSPVYGMRSEGSTGLMSLAKISTAVSPFIPFSDRKLRQNTLAYMDQRRRLQNNGAFKNPFALPIDPKKFGIDIDLGFKTEGNNTFANSGYGAMYFRGEATEEDLAAAYKEVFEGNDIGIKWDDKTNSPLLDTQKMRKRYSNIIKKRPYLANWSNGLVLESGLFRQSILEDLEQFYPLSKQIKAADYNKLKAEIQKNNPDLSEDELDRRIVNSYFKHRLAPGTKIATDAAGKYKISKDEDGSLLVGLIQHLSPNVSKLVGAESGGLRMTSYAVDDAVMDALVRHVYGDNVDAQKISIIRQKPTEIKAKNIWSYLDEALRYTGLKIKEQFDALPDDKKLEFVNALNDNPDLRKWVEAKLQDGELSLVEHEFRGVKNKNLVKQAVASLNSLGQSYIGDGFRFFEENGKNVAGPWIGAGYAAPAANDRPYLPHEINYGEREILAIRNLLATSGLDQKGGALGRVVREYERSANDVTYGSYKKQAENIRNLAFASRDQSSVGKISLIGEDSSWFDLSKIGAENRVASESYLSDGPVSLTKEELLSLPSVRLALDFLRQNPNFGSGDQKDLDALSGPGGFGYGVDVGKHLGAVGSYVAKNLNGKSGKDGVGLGSILPVFFDVDFLNSVKKAIENPDAGDTYDISYSAATRSLDSVLSNMGDVIRSNMFDEEKSQVIGRLVAKYAKDIHDEVFTNNGEIFDRYNSVSVPGSRFYKSISLRATDAIKELKDGHKDLVSDEHDFEMSYANWMNSTVGYINSLGDNKERESFFAELEADANISKTAEKYQSRYKEARERYLKDGSVSNLRKALRFIARRATIGDKYYDEAARVWAFLDRFPNITGYDVVAAKGKLRNGQTLRDQIALNPWLQRILNADDDGDIIAAAIRSGTLQNAYEFTQNAKLAAKYILPGDIGETKKSPTLATLESWNQKANSGDLAKFIGQQVQEGKDAIGELSLLNAGVRVGLDQVGLGVTSLGVSGEHDVNSKFPGILGGSVLAAFLSTLEQDALSAKKIGDTIDTKNGGILEAAVKGISQYKELVKNSRNWENKDTFRKTVLEETQKILGVGKGKSILNKRSLAILAAQAKTVGGDYWKNFAENIVGVKSDSDEDVLRKFAENGITGEQLADLLYGKNVNGVFVGGLQQELGQNVAQKSFGSIEGLIKKHYNLKGRGKDASLFLNTSALTKEGEELLQRIFGSNIFEAEQKVLAEISQAYDNYNTLTDWWNDKTINLNKEIEKVVKAESNLKDLRRKETTHSILSKYLPNKHYTQLDQTVIDEIWKELDKDGVDSLFRSDLKYSDETLRQFVSQETRLLRGDIVHLLQEAPMIKKDGRWIADEETWQKRDREGYRVYNAYKNKLTNLFKKTGYSKDAIKGEFENIGLMGGALSSHGNGLVASTLLDRGYSLLGNEMSLSGFLGSSGISGIADLIAYNKDTKSIAIGDFKTNANGITPENALQVMIYSWLAREMSAEMRKTSSFEDYLYSTATGQKLLEGIQSQAEREYLKQLRVGAISKDEATKNSFINDYTTGAIKKWTDKRKNLDNRSAYDVFKDDNRFDEAFLLHASSTTGALQAFKIATFDSAAQGALKSIIAGRELSPTMERDLTDAAKSLGKQYIEDFNTKYGEGTAGKKAVDNIEARLNSEQKKELREYTEAKRSILELKKKNAQLESAQERARLTANFDEQEKIKAQISTNDKQIKRLQEFSSDKFITSGLQNGIGVTDKKEILNLQQYYDDLFNAEEFGESGQLFAIQKMRADYAVWDQAYARNRVSIGKLSQGAVSLQKTVSDLQEIEKFRDLTKEETVAYQEAVQQLSELKAQIEQLYDLQDEILQKKAKEAEKVGDSDQVSLYEKQIAQIADERGGLDSKLAEISSISAEKTAGIERRERAKDIQTWKQLLGTVANYEDEIQKKRNQLMHTTNRNEKIFLSDNIESLGVMLDYARSRVNEFGGERGGTVGASGELVFKNQRNADIYSLANKLVSAERVLKEKQGQPGGGGGLFGSLGNQFSVYLRRFTGGMAIMRAIAKIRQEVQKLVNQAKELDKVMTNVRIVTNGSKEDTRNLISEYSDLAKQLGVTTKEVAQSGIEWMRQGYEAAEATKLITASLYLSKLGMIDSTTATKSLTSALKGFKLEAAEAMTVVDKLTAIDLRAATSAGDIAEGLAQFANLGSLSGVDIDQAAAYVATIADVTQRGGSSAGQALKTIISRFGNVKAGAYNELNVETDNSEASENLNDVERVLNKIGISIRDTNLHFKDFDEVLADIADKWESLDNVSKKAIANAFAGVRQQEAFVTLLENWDKYEDLLETSRTSKGTAEMKMSSYKEGLEAATSRLQATIEDFVNKAEISELLIQLTNIATHLAKFIPYFIKYVPQILIAFSNIKLMTGGTTWLGSLLEKINKSKNFSGFFSSPYRDYRAIGNNKFAAGIKAFGRGVYGSLYGTRDTDPRMTDVKAGLISQKEHSENRVKKYTEKFLEEQSRGNASKARDFISKRNKEEKKLLELDRQIKAIEEASKTSLANEEAKTKESERQLLAEKEESAASEGGKRAEQEELVASNQQVVNARSNSSPTDTSVNTPANTQNPVVSKKIPTDTPTNSKAVVAPGAVAAASYGINQGIAAYSAYLTSGTTHKDVYENEVSSSEAAKKQGKATVTAFTAAIPLVGRFIGDIVAEKQMKKIDAMRDSINHIADTANKQLDALHGLNSSFQNIKDLSSVAFLSEENSKLLNNSINEYLEGMYSYDNLDLRKTIESYLPEIDDKQQTLNDLFRDYDSKSSKDRQKIIRELEIAQKKAELVETRNGAASEQYAYEQRIQEKLLEYRGALGGGYNAKSGITAQQEAGAKGAGAGVGIAAGGSVAAIGAIIGSTAATGYGIPIAIALAIISGAVIGIGAGLAEASAKRERARQEANWNSKTTIEKISYLNTQEEELLKQQENLGADQKKEYDQINDQIKALVDYRSTLTTYLDWIARKNDEYNRKTLEIALLETEIEGKGYLTELNTVQLDSVSVEAIYKALADKSGILFGMNAYDTQGKLTEDFISLATSVLKTDPEIAQRLRGDNYTVQDIYSGKSGLDPNNRFDRSILENFANALGITIDDLFSEAGKTALEKFKDLKLEDLLRGPAEITESYKEYSELLSSILSGTSSTSEWMDKIIKQFPDLIQYMNNTDELIGAIVGKQRELSNWYLNAQYDQYVTSKEFFEDAVLPVLKGDERTGSIIDAYRERHNIQTVEDLGKAFLSESSVDSDTIKIVAEEILSKYNATSDQFTEDLQKWTNIVTSIYDKQIENLTQQRDAMQDITNQREYELRLVKARVALEEAQTEKVRIYRAGVGWVYEADQEKISEKQKELEDIEKEKDVSALTRQIDLLTSKRDEIGTMYEKMEYENNLKFLDTFAKKYGIEGENVDPNSIPDAILTGVMGKEHKSISDVVNALTGNGTDSLIYGLKETIWDLFNEKNSTKELKLADLVKGERRVDDRGNYTKDDNGEYQRNESDSLKSLYEEWLKYATNQYADVDEANNALAAYNNRVQAINNLIGPDATQKLIQEEIGNESSKIYNISGDTNGSYAGNQIEAKPASVAQNYSAFKRIPLTTLGSASYGYSKDYDNAPAKKGEVHTYSFKTDNTELTKQNAGYILGDVRDSLKKNANDKAIVYSTNEKGQIIGSQTFADFLAENNSISQKEIEKKEYDISEGGNPYAFFENNKEHLKNTIIVGWQGAPEGVWIDSSGELREVEISDIYENNRLAQVINALQSRGDSSSDSSIQTIISALSDPGVHSLVANSSLTDDNVYGNKWFLVFNNNNKGLDKLVQVHQSKLTWLSAKDRENIIAYRDSKSGKIQEIYGGNPNYTPLKRQSGTLNLTSNEFVPTLINELGTEAIITPYGTLTALPSHSGIIPADITKNLWELGGVAPNILRALSQNIITPPVSSSSIFNGDSGDSISINNLTMNVEADDSFDAEAFVRSIKEQAALVRNLR